MKNRKIGSMAKKGDPIIQGRYKFYIESADGSLGPNPMSQELRLNMNHIMVFTSKKNDSVLIVTKYDLTGITEPFYYIYQLLEGEINFITIVSGENFSESMLPKDLLQ